MSNLILKCIYCNQHSHSWREHLCNLCGTFGHPRADHQCHFCNDTHTTSSHRCVKCYELECCPSLHDCGFINLEYHVKTSNGYTNTNKRFDRDNIILNYNRSVYSNDNFCRFNTRWSKKFGVMENINGQIILEQVDTIIGAIAKYQFPRYSWIMGNHHDRYLYSKSNIFHNEIRFKSICFPDLGVMLTNDESIKILESFYHLGRIHFKLLNFLPSNNLYYLAIYLFTDDINWNKKGSILGDEINWNKKDSILGDEIKHTKHGKTKCLDDVMIITGSAEQLEQSSGSAEQYDRNAIVNSKNISFSDEYIVETEEHGNTKVMRKKLIEDELSSGKLIEIKVVTQRKDLLYFVMKYSMIDFTVRNKLGVCLLCEAGRMKEFEINEYYTNLFINGLNVFLLRDLILIVKSYCIGCTCA